MIAGHKRAENNDNPGIIEEEIVGVTVLEINEEGKITSIGIHKRPLEAILKFSAELGRKLEGKIDRSYFYRFSE